jgi:4-hydroxy-2-oxoglutarate aldolase
MAGCSGHSTKQVLEFLADAADAGADYALVLPPAYFAKQSTPAVVERFFDEIAERTPLPIVIYNFPGVCNGIDMDSDQLARLAKKHPRKIVGVKLTCGVVAKITRLSAELRPDEFATFGGQSDFLIGGLASGSAGCICAFGNAFPRTVVKIYDLWKAGKQEEALKLHHIAAMAERGTKGGIATVKYAASIYSAGTAKGQAGIERGGELMLPRHPYTGLSDDAKKTLREIMDPCWEVEKSLQ